MQKLNKYFISQFKKKNKNTKLNLITVIFIILFFSIYSFTDILDNSFVYDYLEFDLRSQGYDENITGNNSLYKIDRVVDGDTVKIYINNKLETVRLIGLDTPETVHPNKKVECFGVEASNKAKELLSNKWVVLEKDSSQGERDKYGRLLFYIFLEDGSLFNKWMIENGYGFEYTYNIPYLYQSDFKNAENFARENNLGLWASGVCENYSEN